MHSDRRVIPGWLSTDFKVSAPAMQMLHPYHGDSPWAGTQSPEKPCEMQMSTFSWKPLWNADVSPGKRHSINSDLCQQNPELFSDRLGAAFVGSSSLGLFIEGFLGVGHCVNKTDINSLLSGERRERETNQEILA